MATTADDIIRNKNSTQTIKQLSRNLLDGKEPSNQQVLSFFNKAAAIMQSLPDYDVIGMEALVERLRLELEHIHDRKDGLDSINKLSTKINVSRTYLAKFRDGGMVCMNIMNRIADAFHIRYLIENYEDQKESTIE